MILVAMAVAINAIVSMILYIPPIPPEASVATCVRASDCILVPARAEDNQCCTMGCGGTEAINKTASAARDAWTASYCTTNRLQLTPCPMFNCFMPEWSKAVCENKLCKKVLVSAVADCNKNDNCLVYLAETVKHSKTYCNYVKNLAQKQSCIDFFNNPPVVNP